MEKTLKKLRNKEPVTIVNMGDSCTVETFATFGRKTWLSLLTEALWYRYGDGNIWMINSARCGNGFEREAERLELSVLRFKPDLVIMGFQLNDARKGENGMTVAKANARKVVERIQAECGSDILFRTANPIVYPYGVELPEGAKPGEAYLDHVERGQRGADATVAFAKELGCQVCDHYSLWARHQKTFYHPGGNPQNLCMRMMDKVHPNSVGHVAFFREIAPFFELAKYLPWEEME